MGNDSRGSLDEDIGKNFEIYPAVGSLRRRMRIYLWSSQCFRLIDP